MLNIAKAINKAHREYVVDDTLTGVQKRAYDKLSKDDQDAYFLDRVANGAEKANKYLELRERLVTSENYNVGKMYVDALKLR